MAEQSQNATELFTTLMTADLDGLAVEDALKLIYLSDLMEATGLPQKDAAVLEYFRANAWSVIDRCGTSHVWD